MPSDTIANAKKELERIVKDQRKAGTPLQLICDYLDSFPVPNSSTKMKALSDVKSDLARVMAERNLTGIKLEEQGEIGKAIALYEANVADLFCGTHPYDRLRILYAKQEDYANAARVCRAFLNVPVYHGRPDQEIRKQFLERYEKLVKRAV
jgi:hypothetical protein